MGERLVRFAVVACFALTAAFTATAAPPAGVPAVQAAALTRHGTVHPVATGANAPAATPSVDAVQRANAAKKLDESERPAPPKQATLAASPVKPAIASPGSPYSAVYWNRDGVAFVADSSHPCSFMAVEGPINDLSIDLGCSPEFGLALHVKPPEGETIAAGETYATNASDPDTAAWMMIESTDTGELGRETGTFTFAALTRGSTIYDAVVNVAFAVPGRGIYGQVLMNVDAPLPALNVPYPPKSGRPPVEIRPGLIGAASDPSTILVENVGNAPATISGLTIAGPDAAAFSIVDATDGCSGHSVSPGLACSFGVSLTAPEAGTFDAEVALAANTGGGAIRIPIEGTAVFLAGDPRIRASDRTTVSGASFPSVAAGPNHVAVLSATGLRIVNRASGALVLDRPSSWIFDEAPGQKEGGLGEVIWDAANSRWIATEMTDDCLSGHLYLAVSDSGDPTAGWTAWSWTLPGTQPNLPRIGTSTDKIVVGFTGRGLFGDCSAPPAIVAGGILTLDLADLLAGGDAAYWSTVVTADDIVPAVTVGAPSADVHIAVRAGMALHIATIHGPADSGVAPTMTDSPNVTVDDRVWDAAGPAVWRDGTLTLGGALAPDALSIGDAVVVEIALPSPTEPAIEQLIEVGKVVGARFVDVGLSADGTIYVSYSIPASTGECCQSVVAYQSPGDPPGSLRRPAKLSTGDVPFGQELLAADPLDASAVWQTARTYAPDAWVQKLTPDATGHPAGTWQIDGGAAHGDEFVVDVDNAPAAGAGVTQVLLSNSATTGNGLLTHSRAFASGGRLRWDLAEAATGGGTWTGPRRLYLQWGDGAGRWSPVESRSIDVSAAAGALFIPIPPTRILDSRAGIGLSGVFHSKVARTFQVVGQAGIPADAIAVTGNLTVTAQTTAGHVTVAPSLQSGVDPPYSSINFLVQPDNRANGLTVGLSPLGRLAAMFVGSTSTATAHVIFDASGYYTRSPGASAGAAMSYHPLAVPVRVVNTKTKTGIGGRLQGGTWYPFDVGGTPGIPLNATAVTGVVTVPKGATEGTHLTVAAPPDNLRKTSTINFKTTEERANNLTIPLWEWSTAFVYYAAKPTSSADFIFDVTGYFTMDASGASYVPIAPARVLDTRPRSTSRPSNPIGFAGPMTAGKAYTFAVGGVGGVPAGAVAVTGNVTITGQTAVGQLIVGPTETSGVLPAWNTLSSPTGQNRANGIVTGLNGTGKLMIMYWASSTAYTSQAIFDVSGYFK